MAKFLKDIEFVIKKIARSQTEQVRKKLQYSKSIIDEYSINKILFLRQDRIGDLIISEPIIRLLRTKYPKLRLDILLSKNNQSAFCGLSQYIDNKYIYQKDLINDYQLLKRLKKGKYDLVVDLMDKKSSTSGLIIKMINPKYSAGLDKENSYIYNFIVPRLDEAKSHIIDRTGKLLNLFGIHSESENLTPQFSLSSKSEMTNTCVIKRLVDDGNKLFIINLAGSNRSKYWGEDNYIEFINLASKVLPDYKFVLIYTNDYSAEANVIFNASSSVLSDVFTSFADYAYALSLADIILTPDTASVHLASAFKKKCIVLYNQDLEDSSILKPWFPYKTEYLAFGTKSGDLNEITPQTVSDSIKKLL